MCRNFKTFTTDKNLPVEINLMENVYRSLLQK
ncbi:CLUMA_CG012221, isoform A [Clunio marinus]|uniref:CLUMA_CG012221, isoform A n=1 Tax=Clunio marinus TaxID=568069 RepID=A0A1J1IGN1_9DIPT|nr:CLUMA_CG012221, isoform A [Clunio marinus]